MEICIKLFSNFAIYHYPSKFRLEVGEASSVEDICQSLRIPKNLPRVNLVNGEVVSDKHILQHGDTLSFFSPVAGG